MSVIATATVPPGLIANAKETMKPPNKFHEFCRGYKPMNLLEDVDNDSIKAVGEYQKIALLKWNELKIMDKDMIENMLAKTKKLLVDNPEYDADFKSVVYPRITGIKSKKSTNTSQNSLPIPEELNAAVDVAKHGHHVIKEAVCYASEMLTNKSFEMMALAKENKMSIETLSKVFHGALKIDAIQTKIKSNKVKKDARKVMTGKGESSSKAATKPASKKRVTKPVVPEAVEETEETVKAIDDNEAASDDSSNEVMGDESDAESDEAGEAAKEESEDDNAIAYVPLTQKRKVQA